ncbi:MAG TPA: bifunctional phosphoribosyl-AMP cyclohydrolase/phosphoribosyl-ATP diphosphatase HisIE [Fusibacter sp.]|nr:bifunctional phosphoribosyl-AMP cyclohydrolase/phosphoribosyl-ATP diphosphatase HisIE [Fusibacter sp.]
MIDFTTLKFASDGLMPCIVVDYQNNEVLMLAYMNQEALKQTLQSQQMTYYSRSRKQLWVKGETSGNRQVLKELKMDCDQDTLIAYVDQTGPACHLGTRTCFETTLYESEKSVPQIDVSNWQNLDILKTLSATITERRQNPAQGSYTNYLLDKGIDKILKKIGEESTETIIGAKNGTDELIYETADLIYHLLVLYENQAVSFSKVLDVLAERQTNTRTAIKSL